VPARLPIVLALLLTAQITTATAPAAHASWTQPQAITGPSATNLHGAGNARGSQAFAWKVSSERFVRLRSQSGLAGHIRARIRLPDGRLGRAQTISSTREIVAHPQIGVSESGDATAVWVQAGRHLRIMAAYRPRGGRFDTPFELGRSMHFDDARPAIVVGRFGDAVVAWNHGRAIQVVRRAGNAICAPRRARACFRPKLSLRAGADHALALGPLGSAYVVWAAGERRAGEFHTRLRMTVIRRSGLVTGREHAVSRAADGDASQPSIAVRRDGRADIAWRASLPAGGEQNLAAPIMAAVSSPGAVTSQPRAVSLHPGERPQLRGNRQGEAILAWKESNPTPQNPDGPQVAVAARPAGADTFGAPSAITPPDLAAGGASLAIDVAGSAHVVYATASASGTAGLTHVRAPGGAFGPPSPLPAGLQPLSLIAAGAKVTAVGLVGSTWQVSDRMP